AQGEEPGHSGDDPRARCGVVRRLVPRRSPMEKVEIKIDDALSDQLTNSAVGFLKFRDNGQEADVAGSGTFVQLGKIKGILTAGHVIDNLPTLGEVGLVRPRSALQNMRVDM